MRALQDARPFRGFLPHDHDMPLGSYAALVGAWSALAAGTLALARANDRVPERVSWSDVALVGLATHKLTRIIGNDFVTAPLRAPFTRYQENLGEGEIADESRGDGMRRAMGDLLTCPMCLGPWVGGALTAGLLMRPRETRVVAGLFAAVAISDFLHNAYVRLWPPSETPEREDAPPRRAPSAWGQRPPGAMNRPPC